MGHLQQGRNREKNGQGDGSGPVVECHSLSKSYGTVKALDSADLCVEKGQIYALLGPNGAGKTTLIRVLTGLMTPDSGTATVLGANPQTGRKRISGRMGVVLEDANPYPHMTGGQYLSYFARLFFPDEPKMKKQQRVDYCLRMTGLTKAGGVETWKYSHGMKKRLIFARALINDPELLILDEPLTGLDPLVSSRLKNTLRALNQEGRTILFSTHILPDAEKLCTSVGIIHRGRMVVQGPLKDLRDRFPSRRFRITATSVDQDLVDAFTSMDFVLDVTVESPETLLVLTKDLDTEEARRTIRRKSPPSVISVSLIAPSLDEIFLQALGRSWEAE